MTWEATYAITFFLLAFYCDDKEQELADEWITELAAECDTNLRIFV